MDYMFWYEGKLRPIVDVGSTDGHHRALPLCAILSTACKLSKIVLVIPKQGMKLVDEREELSKDGGGGGGGGWKITDDRRRWR